ncbi:MAG: restriction endonuclease subunit S [Bacteroidia bacterium]|nr:restriction endonuclease subunit S [Bacteroidia bacterium]
MKQGWEIAEFEKCLEKVTYTNKIQRKDFKEDGIYPIVSQEKDFINGYWDNEEDLFKVDKPVVIFGDHTQVIKFIDFDFVLGADGVKILKPKDKIDSKYFYYFLQNVDLGSLGYARHYRLLKEINIAYPKSLPEQQRIVSILDEAFAAIAKAKANAEQNLKNAKELFESYLQGVFENGNWETKSIEMVCDEIFAGGDAPKNNFSLEPNEKHNIPIYANAVKDRGLYGFTDFARVKKPCVTIAARGSGTGHTELRNEHFLPIVRLIVCIPDTEQISNEFLKYTIDNLVIQRSGSAIPQLTVPMIKDYKIPVPSIEEQKLIIEKAETLKQQKEILKSVYLKKIERLEELKKSILQKAFAGELKTEKAVAV